MIVKMSTNADPSIVYIHAKGYPGGLLDLGEDVERGSTVKLYSRINDLETPSDALTVYISYKNPSGTWTRELASYYAPSNYWYYDWVIPFDAELGLYDVRVEASDLDGGSAEEIETSEFNVI